MHGVDKLGDGWSLFLMPSSLPFFALYTCWKLFHCAPDFLDTPSPATAQFSSVQSLSRVWLFATPWIAARQASLSITNTRSSLKLMSIESVMQSNHLILCCPLLLLPSIFSNIRVFSNESFIHIRWPNNSKLSFIYFLMQQINTQRLNKSWKLEQPFSQAH